MRIGICLSGQPRTINITYPSILNFFSKKHQYDYFCHSWDYDVHKHKKTDGTSGVYWSEEELVDRKELEKLLLKFNPKAYKIQGKQDLPLNFIHWNSLFYSAMYANHLKKQYEIENDFRYDLVIKTRYDLIYDPNTTFDINHPLDSDLDLYCLHNARMFTEYGRPNFSDIMYYGSSRAMDCISDVYKYIYSDNSREDNKKQLGPGCWMTEYNNKNNLRGIEVRTFNETIYRKTAISLDTFLDFQQTHDHHINYYT